MFIFLKPCYLASQWIYLSWSHLDQTKYTKFIITTYILRSLDLVIPCPVFPIYFLLNVWVENERMLHGIFQFIYHLNYLKKLMIIFQMIIATTISFITALKRTKRFFIAFCLNKKIFENKILLLSLHYFHIINVANIIIFQKSEDSPLLKITWLLELNGVMNNKGWAFLTINTGQYPKITNDHFDDKTTYGKVNVIIR